MELESPWGWVPKSSPPPWLLLHLVTCYRWVTAHPQLPKELVAQRELDPSS